MQDLCNMYDDAIQPTDEIIKKQTHGDGENQKR